MLNIHDLTCSFDNQQVLRGVDFDIQQGEIFCLLGPSGCGKTTLLRIIAGLEEANRGDILLNEQSIIAEPVHKRGFGLMFQDFALFPHLTVSKNVMFGLKMQGVNSHSQQGRLGEVLQLVGLEGFENRDVSQLSGGEKQRVAIARALLGSPSMLLCDEPTGNLDSKNGEIILKQLIELKAEYGATLILVTHNPSISRAADRVMTLKDGQITG